MTSQKNSHEVVGSRSNLSLKPKTYNLMSASASDNDSTDKCLESRTRCHCQSG
jgi:hypothetical protein